jgi:hypothetical protein
MSYERKVVEIEAVRLVSAIYDKEHYRVADKGEWLIVDGDVQLYMKDEDFHRTFVKKPPEKEIVTETVTVTQPIYVNPCPPVVYPQPCIDPWPWWKRGDIICWTDSSGYRTQHPYSDNSTNIVT